jgi:hypothetical protein
MKLTGENRSTRGKTCPSATLSTTNPTWADPGWNPRLRGGRPAANRLSHGTALHRVIFAFGHTTRDTLGRIPLDEWCDSRRDLYLTAHKTHNRQTYMYVPGGILIRDRSNRATADRRLRPPGHWDRRVAKISG